MEEATSTVEAIRDTEETTRGTVGAIRDTEEEATSTVGAIREEAIKVKVATVVIKVTDVCDISFSF